MTGIFTMESLHGVAWILAGLWTMVKLIEMVVERWDTLTSYSRDLESLYRRLREANETIENLELENAMMKKHFFPDVAEVMTAREEPVRAKPKRGRPRKK